jgi:hypothetical protein
LIEVLGCYEFFWGGWWYEEERGLYGVVSSPVSFRWCKLVVGFDIDASLPYVGSVLIV